MSYRYNLTDAQWERIAGFFPDRYHHGHRGRPWKEHRRLVNGILWHLHTGAPWPDTPRRYGPWQTVYDRFNRWRKDGTWANILDALLLELDQAGVIDRDLWCFDGTINRAHTSAAGAKKKSRPGAAIGWSEGGANARAAGPCVGALAGRFWHQDAPGL
jgi:transposase